jgi:hypothetical protein
MVNSILSNIKNPAFVVAVMVIVLLTLFLVERQPALAHRINPGKNLL